MNESNLDFETYLSNFKDKVSKMGFKNSVQKDYILKALYHTDEHLSVEEIALAVKQKYNIDVGIATVYRTMSFLENLGIVESLDVGDSTKRYELGLSVHHDHLVCTKCSKIIEFSDEKIELNQIKIAESNGFIMRDHIMTIYGLCEECQ